MPDAIQMARRMAREWSDCSHCFQLQDESLGYSEGWLLPPAAPAHAPATESPANGTAAHDAAGMDETGATADEDPDYRTIEVFQRRGTGDTISYMEVAPRDASAVAAAMAASNPGVVVVVTDPSDPPGLSAVIATDALPDHGLGGPGAGVDPATSITVVDGHTTTMMVANPMPAVDEAPPPRPQPPPTTPTTTPTPTPTHLMTPSPPQQPPQQSDAPRRSPTARHALVTVATTVALSLTAPRAGALRTTTRLARQPAWTTLLGGALLAAAAASRLPTAHSSPAPAPGGGGWPALPTRPTTPAPDDLPPLAGTEPCPRLTDYQEAMRQHCHAFLWDGVDDVGLCPFDSTLRALALFEQSADETGLSNQDVHTVGNAFANDLRPAHLWDRPHSATNREWLRQQVYVRAHCMVTAIGGDAWTADQIAGIASRQTQDRREFRLHDTRRRHNNRWWDSVDLDWFLNEYDILQRIWPVGTPLEADLWTEHGQSPPGAAAPHDTAAQGADEPPSTSSAEMAEAGQIDDGAIPDASAHRTHTQDTSAPATVPATPGAPSPTSPATPMRRPKQSSAMNSKRPERPPRPPSPRAMTPPRARPPSNCATPDAHNMSSCSPACATTTPTSSTLAGRCRMPSR